MRLLNLTAIGALCASIGLLAGCDKSQSEKPAQGTATVKPAEQPKAPLVPVTQVADWCKEHGVPESVCTRCNESLVAKFQEKGDWCKEHNLPESQCFECHPELKQKFADAYKAKYGKEPPALISESGNGGTDD
jgi:hypothetical protein